MDAFKDLEDMEKEEIDTDNSQNDEKRMYEDFQMQSRIERERQSQKDQYLLKKVRKNDLKQGKKESIVWKDED